ncbi:MAG TPA: hypothetical protein VMX13_09180 [Sedimentisphaerales bacterium]|nr:hypothetical protein [Sedimentisphaerales bacterium]
MLESCIYSVGLAEFTLGSAISAASWPAYGGQQGGIIPDFGGKVNEKTTQDDGRRTKDAKKRRGSWQLNEVFGPSGIEAARK